MAINAAAQKDYQRVYGVKPQVGMTLPELLEHLPEQLQQAVTVWNRALAGEAFDLQSWWGAEGTAQRAYEMRFRPVRDESGTIYAAYLLGRDVTDLLREQERLAAAEEQLRQSQKMEAIGQLTGGVAHDFNNLLTPIVGSLDILSRKNLGGEREQRLIAGAAQAAERAKVLVQRLLSFARRQPLQPTAVDSGELVRGMAELIASTTGPQINVNVEVAGDVPPAHADRNQLEMALLNLAVNARDAMPDGGTLRISAASDAGVTPRPSGLKSGSYVVLTVSDTGVGMSDETAARAIEPFFSTKGIGKGTGLGLSMVHGLALQLGGALQIRSKLGVGTKIELWLPVSQARPEQIVSEAGPDRATGQRGIVLLVDDDPLVRETTAMMLEEFGYQVVEAPTTEAARQKLETGLKPSLIITDHLMPGETGTEFARWSLSTEPNRPVLIVSGYSDVEDIAPDLKRLTKPFLKDELFVALEDARPKVNP